MKASPLCLRLVATIGLVVVLSWVTDSGSWAAQLDPPAPGLGRDATLRLDTAPADSTVVPSGFGVLVWPTEDPVEFRVRPVRVGRVGVFDLASGDTLWWEVPREIEQADPSRLRPIHRIDDAGPSWWRQTLAALLLLTALILLLRHVVRRTRPAVEVPLSIVEPPHLVALRRLEALGRSRWLDDDRYDDWYVEGSHALREYVGGRYRVAALDWTSGELLQRLVESGYSRDDLSAVEPLLCEADSVKFAASRPTTHQAQSWLQCIVSFVEATAVEVVYSTPEALAAAQRLNQRGLP
jgi:hypothetical protein